MIDTCQDQRGKMTFNLFFDEETLKRMEKKLSGFPVYAGPNGDLLSPGVVDVLDESIMNQWQPGNEYAELLVLGVAACQDILFYSNQFLEPKTRKRAMYRMSVPICTLIDVVKRLLVITNTSEAHAIRLSWPIGDQESYKKLSKRLKKMNANSPVRRVRNKLSAHLDADVFVEKIPSLLPDNILEPMADCAILLMLSFNYPSEFSQWIRFIGILEDKKHLAVETMYAYPLCTRWITDLKGHVEDVESMTLAADPRYELQESIMAIISYYNSMIKAVNSTLPEIFMIPSNELHKQEEDEEE